MKVKVIRRVIIAVAAVALIVAMALTTKIVKPGDAVPTSGASNGLLDPKTWAQENYESQLVPAIKAKAQPWGTLIAAIVADPEAAGKQYGQREEGANNYSYSTSITGTLAEGEFGEVAVTTDGTPAGVTVGMVVGPAISGSAVRDASGLLKFGMFTNQTDYQQAGAEINNMVKKVTLANFDATASLGKKFTIIGAFTWDPAKTHASIVPVSIEAAS